jgi:hypothetical protein
MKRRDNIQQAIEHLRKAVNLLCIEGYASLSRDEQCACNWASMARDQLVQKHVKPSDVIEMYIKGQVGEPKIVVGGASHAQQVRMDKAVRRYAKRARKTGNIY